MWVHCLIAMRRDNHSDETETVRRRKSMWGELRNVVRGNSTPSFSGPKGEMYTRMTIDATFSGHRRQARDLEPLPHIHRILDRYGMEISETWTENYGRDTRVLILEETDDEEAE